MFLSFVELDAAFYYWNLSLWFSSKLAIKMTEELHFSENPESTIPRMTQTANEPLQVEGRMCLVKKVNKWQQETTMGRMSQYLNNKN